MKTIIIILTFLSFCFDGCKHDKTENETNKSYELKERELDLKEKELELKEKEMQDKERVNSENSNTGINGYYPEVSLTILSDSDLNNRDAWELRIMRNEVFARYGYIFKLPELREYFLKQNWYIPRYEDVSNMLTPLEKENIEKIKRYEAYIGSKYNSYSR